MNAILIIIITGARAWLGTYGGKVIEYQSTFGY